MTTYTCRACNAPALDLDDGQIGAIENGHVFLDGKFSADHLRVLLRILEDGTTGFVSGIQRSCQCNAPITAHLKATATGEGGVK